MTQTATSTTPTTQTSTSTLTEIPLFWAAGRKEKARRRLIDFVCQIAPWFQPAAHHVLICEKLEAVIRGEIDRLMLFLPPRHGKSTLASIAFPAWYLGRNPTRSIIATAYAGDLGAQVGGDVRNIIRDETYAEVFPKVTLTEDEKARTRWSVLYQVTGRDGVRQGGRYIAAGVGGQITGRGGNILTVDDPVKGREEANSLVYRERAYHWYTSDFYTRQDIHGAAIVMIQCMTGDTPVLMANGRQKPLARVRPGDYISSYDQPSGILTTARVTNWASQGLDDVFEIRTASGARVKANARHPFLVEEKGELKWVRTDTLKRGDAILRVTGANGEALHVQEGDATSPQSVRGCARPVMARSGRLKAATGGAPKRTVPLTCDTDTASSQRTTTGWWPSNLASAPFAVSHPTGKTPERTGPESSVSTTATKPRGSVACSVTTATSPSDTARLQTSSEGPQTTYRLTLDVVVSVTPWGEEEVFDLEVERTENFIANGLVSHNTRWHPDDLSGRLLEDMKNGGDQWEILKLPALAIEGEEDLMGRAPGDPLWPEFFPVERYERIKKALTMRAGLQAWESLYQQSPIVEGGDYFKVDRWITPYMFRMGDEPKGMSIYMTSDYAVDTKTTANHTVHCVWGVDGRQHIWLLAVYREQANALEWALGFIRLVKRWEPIYCGEEVGQIRKSVGPFLDRLIEQHSAYCARSSDDGKYVPSTNKGARAQGIRGRMQMGMVHIPVDQPWTKACSRPARRSCRTSTSRASQRRTRHNAPIPSRAVIYISSAPAECP